MVARVERDLKSGLPLVALQHDLVKLERLSGSDPPLDIVKTALSAKLMEMFQRIRFSCPAISGRVGPRQEVSTRINESRLCHHWRVIALALPKAQSPQPRESPKLVRTARSATSNACAKPDDDLLTTDN